MFLFVPTQYLFLGMSEQFLMTAEKRIQRNLTRVSVAARLVLQKQRVRESRDCSAAWSSAPSCLTLTQTDVNETVAALFPRCWIFNMFGKQEKKRPQILTRKCLALNYDLVLCSN